MKKTILRMSVVALTLGFAFTACNQNEEKSAQPDEVAVTDNTSGLGESDDVIAVAEDAMDRGGASMRVSAEKEVFESTYGATVTITRNGDGTGSIVIDFGAGLTSRDGRSRKGKILVDYSGRHRTNNSQQIITFDNYFVENNKVEGKKTLFTTTDYSSTSYPVFFTSIKVEGGKITWRDGKITEWASDRVRKYDYKNTLTDLGDDEVTITGTASGKSRDGRTFTAAVASPLVLTVSCAVSQKSWLPVKGVLEVTPQNDLKRTVNYGNGNCERTVTISVNDRSWEIMVR